MARRQASTGAATTKLAQLGRVAAQLEANDRKRDDLYHRRLVLFLELRELGVTQREIAEHAGLTEMAVTKALRKAREAAA